MLSSIVQLILALEKPSEAEPKIAISPTSDKIASSNPLLLGVNAVYEIFGFRFILWRTDALSAI